MALPHQITESKEGTFCYTPGIKQDKEAHKEGPLFLLLLLMSYQMTGYRINMQHCFECARDFRTDSFFGFQGVAEITSVLRYATLSVRQSGLQSSQTSINNLKQLGNWPHTVLLSSR